MTLAVKLVSCVVAGLAALVLTSRAFTKPMVICGRCHNYTSNCTCEHDFDQALAVAVSWARDGCGDVQACGEVMLHVLQEGKIPYDSLGCGFAAGELGTHPDAVGAEQTPDPPFPNGRSVGRADNEAVRG